MANKHLLNRSLKAAVPKDDEADSAWFYENPSGLLVVTRVICACGKDQRPFAKLRWDQLRKSLERKDRK